MVQFEIEHIAGGILYTLSCKSQIGYVDQIDRHGETVIAIDMQNDRREFYTCFLLIKADGSTDYVAHLGDESPNLFKDPDGEILIVIDQSVKNKSRQITKPLFNHNLGVEGVITRDFGCNCAGFIGDSAYSSRGRKIDKIDFERGKIVKVSSKNFRSLVNVTIINDQLHILTESEENELTHQLVDEKYKTLLSRSFQTPHTDNYQPVEVGFDITTTLLAYKEGSSVFELWTLQPDNRFSSKELLNLENEIDILYNGVLLESGATLFCFASEKESGWMLIKNGVLLECFIGNGNLFQSKLDKSLIALSSDERWIVGGANATKGNGYALGFYPSRDKKGDPAKKILLLSRTHD